MQNKSNQKSRRLNYQVLQDKKESSLIKKEVALKNELLKNESKITEFDNQFGNYTNESEKLLLEIVELQNLESKDIKERKAKIIGLNEQIVLVKASLNEKEAALKLLIEQKQKDAQDSPRALEVKSRLAYLNTEINENNYKINEYKKEAKREQSLKNSIEKLKKEEVRLESLIAAGEKSSKHNYEEELEIEIKQRQGFEKQLHDFVNAENVEIALLTDIIAEMSKEAAILNEELDKLRKSQESAAVAMQAIESDPDVVGHKKDITGLNAQISKHNEDIAKLNQELNEIKVRELEAARQQGKEQDYLSIGTKIDAAQKRIKEIETNLAVNKKETVKLTAGNEKITTLLSEVDKALVECRNYNVWISNNKRLSEEMYPVALELAARDLKKDRKQATEETMPKLEVEARAELKSETDTCRKRAEEIFEAKSIKVNGHIRDTSINNITENLIKRKIERYIADKIDAGTFETWNNAFRKIRNNRLSTLEKKLDEAEQQYKKSKDSDSEKAFNEAKTAKEMFFKAETDNTLLVIKNLRKYFPVEKSFFGRPTRYLKAVDDISLRVKKGKTLGIVGESGCGKTTMGRTVLKLHEITDGEIIFDGHHIEKLGSKDMRSLRTDLQIIFQDPYSSLSPRLPIGEIIGEAVRAHKLVPNNEYKDYIMGIMKSCGLQPHHFSRFPHEFSGGQRQRICIARALAVNPKVVICDEPVSALDVSIQAQIINLLKDLQKTRNLTYIFISHDLSVVEHISDDVGVMYLGSMVESGPKEKIFDNPMHPYTEALLSAVPVPDPNVKMNRIFLKGDIPSPSRPPRGCKFHTRCHKCMDVCRIMPPVFKEYEKDHFVACHLYPQE